MQAAIHLLNSAKPAKNILTGCYIAAILFSVLCIFQTGRVYAQAGLHSVITEVQQNSQQSYDSIDSVYFEGRSKAYVYFGFKPFGIQSVPYLKEYYFRGYWIKPDSLRLNITAFRSVSPDSSDEGFAFNESFPLPNPFRFTYDPSAFGMQKTDKKGLSTHIWPVYPFAKGSDSLYNYSRAGTMESNRKKIWIVNVEPKRADIPAVVGTFYLDPDEKIVVGSDVQFNEAASFTKAEAKREKNSFTLNLTGSENHRMKTKKALLFSTYWLPQEIEEEFDILYLGVKIKAYRIIEFSMYEVNPSATDTVFAADSTIRFNRDKAKETAVFPEPGPDGKLTRSEQEELIAKSEDQFSETTLFNELLGNKILANNALKVSQGLKGGRFLQMVNDLGEAVIYNRVEGLQLNQDLSFANPLIKGLLLSVSGGYGFGDEKWKYTGTALFYLNGKRNLFLEGSLYNTVHFNESGEYVSNLTNSLTSVGYKTDYRDYFYRKGFSIGIGYTLSENSAIKAGFSAHKEESAGMSADFSIFRNKRPFRPNPEILAGDYRGVTAKFLYRTHLAEGNLAAEYTDKETFGSDYSFTGISGTVGLNLRTGYYSRLYLNVSGGYSDGYLPPQRWYDLGGKVIMRYHGSLRGTGYKYFTGSSMASAVAEYELNGSILTGLLKKKTIFRFLKLSFWGGLAKSDLSDKSLIAAAGLNVPLRTTDGTYHEAGIGISDRLNLFRADLIKNSISGNEIRFGFNILR